MKPKESKIDRKLMGQLNNQKVVNQIKIEKEERTREKKDKENRDDSLYLSYFSF